MPYLVQIVRTGPAFLIRTLVSVLEFGGLDPVLATRQDPRRLRNA